MAPSRALRTLRRASLRPLLLLLILIFVLIPLAVYHVATFDFQRVASLERRFHLHPSSSSEPVPACLSVASVDFFQSNAQLKLQARCGVPTITVDPPKLTSQLRLVHFVHVAQDWDAAEEDPVEREQFTYLQFAALQSVRRVLRPDMMMMHYPDAPPRGVWYTQCQRHLGLHQVLPPVALDASLPRHKRRRITELLLMLRALKKHGGVAFSDFNTFLVRGIQVDVHAPLVVASQTTGSSGRFSLGLHMMQAPPGHPFVAFLEEEIVRLVEEKDPELHEMTVDEVVGRVVLEKFRRERGDGSASNATSVVDGVAIGTSALFEFDGLHELLTAKLGPSLAGKFRGVAGFHVDRDGIAEHTADKENHRQIERMQKELTLADEWQTLDTLLGAVVRLAVTANTTAELEPLFT